MKKEKLVVIGNGMAGLRTVEELLERAPDHYDITVIGDEPYGNYNRILLSPVLAGEKTIDEIMLNDLAWYDDNNVTLLHGEGMRVEEIRRSRKVVITEDGTELPYDRLLIATGSKPFMLPLPGADLDGVIAFRDIKDVDTMLAAAKEYKSAVVIGGGLLGLEAANGLMKNGMSVTVIHLLDSLMEMQLDSTAAQMLKNSLIERGMKFEMKASTKELLGDTRVEKIVLDSGEEIAADLVVMAVGIRPNIELAQKAGIHCERGIVVDDTMLTFDPAVHAVGECAQHRGIAYGLVAPLFEQAKVCANHLAQKAFASYKGSTTSTKLKVTGIDLFSAGDFKGSDTTEEIVLEDKKSGIYKKIVLENDKIKGAVLYGDTIDGAWYYQLMREGSDVSEMRRSLMFGQSHVGDSGTGGMDVSSMSDDMEICGCNGVSKGDIVHAISSKGLFTLEDVRSHTKASSSCGTCTGLVEQILMATLGSDYSAAPSEKAMCKCTDHSHDRVRNTIIENEIKSIPEVMKFLDWKNPDGCASCRPAINYYLLCAWPTEYVDDGQSRFINERAHGNIQKDGSYSVVPRMFGGLCTADDLRAIADVSDKYAVPEMKVTGGQRIDLFGVKKQDLPDMWEDLSKAGFVSGHAYGKAMRTCKTCAGSNWCRFGTKDSTGLGVKVEELTWGSWMPHKFKFAVSGCPRNCAEATIKDFGIVCVDSGYELHVGGNGGIKVRVTDFMTKVETEEQVLEWAGAFCQHYREDAHYLERTAPWIERIGLAPIKEILEDDKTRLELYERFKISQIAAQIDPWKARISGELKNEFIPMKDLVAK
jgi:nitrite reductase [NAD(P)H] large subunit